jgi:hypothetical protein
MFRSRFPTLVWLIVSIAAVYVWWFAKNVVLFWATKWTESESSGVPPEFSPVFNHPAVAAFLFYLVCAWVGCLAALIWALPRKLGGIERQLQAAVVISLAMAAYLLAAAAFASLNVNRFQAEKLAYWEETLKRFALMESAQGRWEKFQSDMGAFDRASIVKAPPVEQWTDEEIRAELHVLTSMLAKQPIETQRMVLATIAQFRKRISSSPRIAYELRGLPAIASKLGLGEFSDPSAVLESVASKSHEREWASLPLLRFKVGQP